MTKTAVLPTPKSTGAPRPAARSVRQGREQIMAAIRAAGIAEFSEKGLNGTSTQAIAKRAGLTKPQLHYYIAGKKRFYEDLLMSVVSDWKGMFDAGSTDPGQVLGSCCCCTAPHSRPPRACGSCSDNCEAACSSGPLTEQSPDNNASIRPSFSPYKQPVAMKFISDSSGA